MTFIKTIKESFLYIILAILLGVLWHFLYDWFGKNSIIGIICPVNESTWEHLKLLFYPVLLISILEYKFKRIRDGFWVGRTYGILYGMASIIVLFYTYMGVVGIESAPVNIIIFIIGVFVAFGISGRYYELRSSTFTSQKVFALIIILAFILAFGVFSFYPPDINLFIQP